MEIFQAVLGGGNSGDNDDGDSTSQSRGPCCSICCGLILIMIAPYVIWHNEGDYVKIQQVLDKAGQHAKQPCEWDSTGKCDNCRLDDLKEGDLVFLACKFNKMRTLTDLAKESKFEIEELAPALSGSEEAVGFKWKAEMYQWTSSETTVQIPLDTPDCGPLAQGLDDDNDPGATRRKDACCKWPFEGDRRYINQYYGPNKRCQPYFGGPSPPKTLVQADISFAKEAQVGQIAFEDNALNEDQAESIEFHNHSVVQVRRLKGGSTSDTRRRNTKFECSFDCYSWKVSWHDTLQKPPYLWAPVPVGLQGVKCVESSPAENLNLPYQGEQSYLSDTDSGVNLGGITVGSFKPIRDAMKYDKVANPSPNPAMGRETLGFSSELDTKAPGFLEYTKSERNMPWTAKQASVSDNCLVSRNGQDYQVGDLKICFHKTSLTQLTVLAEVKKCENFMVDGLCLAVSEKHLKANTKLKMTTSGYRMELGRLIRFDEYMDSLISENEGSLFAFRIIGPCLLWAAFYCCLSPIVWLIDKFGDMLESVPCVGGCLGILANILETLATILICIISCCCGVACGLMAMAVAWVYYRPLIGIPLLILSTAMFVGVGYFMYTRRDPNKPSRRSVRMSTVGAAVELQEQQVQPPVAVATPQPTTFQVQCPEESGAGSQILVTTPDGRQVSVIVPEGVSAGQMFQVQA